MSKFYNPFQQKRFCKFTPGLSPFWGCCLAVIDVCAIPFVLAEFSSINEIKLLLFHYNTRANDAGMFLFGLI